MKNVLAVFNATWVRMFENYAYELIPYEEYLYGAVT